MPKSKPNQLTWPQRRHRAIRDAAMATITDPNADEYAVAGAMAELESASADLSSLAGVLPPWFLWEVDALVERLQVERANDATPTSEPAE